MSGPAASPFQQPKAVWAVAFASVVAFMGIGLVDPILKPIADNLNASPSQVSLLFTSYMAVMGVAMLITGVVASRIGPKRTLLVGLVIMILPAVLPASLSEINGARIWIRVAGFTIQPGEFAKILLTVFAASYLVQKRDVLALAGRRFLGIDFPRGRDFGPVLVVWLLCIGVLVRGHDLGTSLLFFGLFVVLLYVATERVSWVIVGTVLFVGGAYISYGLFGTVQTRVSVWLHPFAAANVNTGYQLRQSLFGLGTGGIFGTGLGSGHPEFVPLPATDFIISSFGEEIGLFGVAGLIALYALFISRGIAAGLSVRDSFGKLLAIGLSWLVALQLFVVIAGVTRLLPETGLTTPFLSYGGSSLLGSWIILALLLRISDAARRPATTPPPKTPAIPAVGVAA